MWSDYFLLYSGETKNLFICFLSKIAFLVHTVLEKNPKIIIESPSQEMLSELYVLGNSKSIVQISVFKSLHRCKRSSCSFRPLKSCFQKRPFKQYSLNCPSSVLDSLLRGCPCAIGCVAYLPFRYQEYHSRFELPDKCLIVLEVET